VSFRHLVLVAILACLACASPSAHCQTTNADWPQWRGPLGTGAAPQGNPPIKWDETTNIRWKTPVPGDGTSTPIVVGSRIFIQTAIAAKGEAAGNGVQQNDRPPGKSPPPPPPGKGPPPGENGKKGFGPKGDFGGKRGFGDKGGKGGPSGPPPTEPVQFVLLCMDKATGKTIWQRVCREEVPKESFRLGDGSFAASSAATDGQHVYAFFGSRGLYCYDLDGNLKWEKDFGDQRTRNGFGEGATPALFGNTVVVPWDHEEEDFIVALDKRTGADLWRQSRDEPTGWSTPLVVEHAGKAQVVIGGTNSVRSYDLATGQQVWESEGLTTNVIPSAVTAEGVVFITSGYQGNKLLAIRLGGQGDLSNSDNILWRLTRSTPYVPSPLLSGQRIYFFDTRNTLLSCHDIRTGKPHFGPERIENLGTVYASPVAAGGHVYLVGRNGTSVVIKDADKLEIVSTNALNDPIDASPAVVGNQIFLRSRNNLYCIEEK
jgi:outer membrane protein assembly factor BamB